MACNAYLHGTMPYKFVGVPALLADFMRDVEASI